MPLDYQILIGLDITPLNESVECFAIVVHRFGLLDEGILLQVDTEPLLIFKQHLIEDIVLECSRFVTHLGFDMKPLFQ